MADESQVVALVEAYLKHREDIKPLLEEEEPANDEAVLKALTDEERKHREEAKAAKAAAAKAALDEAHAKEAAAVAAMDPLGKIQHESDVKTDELLKEIAGRLAVNRLTKAQKDQLF